ncbi:ABC transporter ATP-binding protein [Desulfatitalea alkaliphila]|uniref:ABC transporter ATP-binding protein n=1 Tax=Desulfatitalea alkaliphila TaxID=2929485 RepID=A0AA41UJJ7_9BACT|nr:ABC transporter ATP-binding protein [Desulfatitalea alkaliphila]MCJ8502005.1 ABC transporter ATP-binding protein [Desulfatitalea alkaliphila]
MKTTTAPILECRGIIQRYGRLTAVDDLSLAVPPGICFGLLGPNGAGKTTLIEILEDIIRPTAGEVFYLGKPRTSLFRQQIGIMFQQTALLAFMTVQETLATFHKLFDKAYDLEELIRLCHLDDIRKQLNDKISGGQRQRLLLALALINQPELLFLDEPSTGLDPQARRNLWDIVHQVRSQGKTIILTTHYMDEAQHLCDIVSIMDHGRIIATGSPQQLIARHTRGINITLPPDAAEAITSNAIFQVNRLADRVVLQVTDLNRAIQALLEASVDLTHMSVQSPTLETVFLNLTGRKLRE